MPVPAGVKAIVTKLEIPPLVEVPVTNILPVASTANAVALAPSPVGPLKRFVQRITPPAEYLITSRSHAVIPLAVEPATMTFPSGSRAIAEAVSEEELGLPKRCTHAWTAVWAAALPTCKA